MLALSKFLNTAAHFAIVPYNFSILNTPTNARNFCPISGDTANHMTTAINEVISKQPNGAKVVRITCQVSNGGVNNHAITVGASDGVTDAGLVLPINVANGFYDSGAISITLNQALAGLIDTTGFTVGGLSLSVTVFVQQAIQ